MKNCIIILPTHSSYKEIVINFLQLLKKNWETCPFKIIISITGNNVTVKDYECIYNGKNASLIECIVNASKKYKTDYYINFLGDAFINKKINNSFFLKELKNLINNDIDYCSLNYVKKYKKEKKFNQYFRYINNLDRYSHSFVAFIASYKYINEELIRFKSDLDFEKYYLNLKDNQYFANHLIIRKNFLGLIPSINKGKWDRINYLKLIKDNPEISFEKRDISSLIESILYHIRKHIIPYIPKSIRRYLKKNFISNSIVEEKR